MQIIFGMKRPKSFIANSILRQSEEYQRLYDSLPEPTTPEILANNKAILEAAEDRILRAHPRWPEVEQERKEDTIREANGEFKEVPPVPEVLPLFGENLQNDLQSSSSWAAESAVPAADGKTPTQKPTGSLPNSSAQTSSRTVPATTEATTEDEWVRQWLREQLAPLERLTDEQIKEAEEMGLL